jgi:predicted small secreted protein
MMLKRFVALLALGAMVAFAAGCNTVAGAGADVKAAGAGIEKAAEKTKPY